MYFAPTELDCKKNDVGYKHFVPNGTLDNVSTLPHELAANGQRK